MAQVFVFRRRESLADAFRRIAAAQVERAAAVLTAGLPLERRIHDARKHFKESRALVRLFRRALGDAFDEENHRYRDAGRALSAFRDATVAAGAVRALPFKLRHEIGRRAMRQLRATVQERRAAVYADAFAVDGAIAHVLVMLDAARASIGALALHDVEDAVEKGFASIVAAGRESMREAYGTDDADDFHEWRKRVKDHWYHVQLFLPVWPQLMKVREKAFHDLSHLLGDHHDLGVVAALAADSKEITRVLAARQKAIVAEADPIGRRLYSTRPGDLARETIALWRVWHRG